MQYQEDIVSFFNQNQSKMTKIQIWMIHTALDDTHSLQKEVPVIPIYNFK